MSTEDQNCETPSGCVRKHITALEAANGRNRSCSPKVSAEVKAEASCKALNHRSPLTRQSTGSVQLGHADEGAALDKGACSPVSLGQVDAEASYKALQRRSPVLRQSADDLQLAHAARHHHPEPTTDEASHCMRPAMRQSTGSLWLEHAIRQQNSDTTADKASHCKSQALRQSTGDEARNCNSESMSDEDITSWEAALKQAAGSHKTLVHAAEQYKQLLEESEAKLQQERASRQESIRHMSRMTMELKEKTAALDSQEASVGSLRSSEANLSQQVIEQRKYIQELQAKLIASLREDLSRLPAQWQVSHDILRVVRETTKLLQQAERRLDAASPWKAKLSGLQAEDTPGQAAASERLGTALSQIQTLQAMLADQQALLDRRQLQVVMGACQSCVELSSICLMVTIHFVDSCIGLLLPGRAESWTVKIEPATCAEEAGRSQERTAVCRGPAGRMLRFGYRMTGAGCGVALGLYKACFEGPVGETFPHTSTAG